MNIKLDGEQFKKIGSTGLKIGKAIVFEGTKALVVKAAVKSINTGFENGVDGIKNLTLDDVIGKKEKTDEPKKKWFSKKEKVTEEVAEEDVKSEDDKTK